MKTFAIIVLTIWVVILANTSCRAEGLYVTVGVGENGQFFSDYGDDWNDEGGTGAFVLMSYQWNQQRWCFGCRPSVQYAHLSQWEVNTSDEDWVDHFGLAGTWALWER